MIGVESGHSVPPFFYPDSRVLLQDHASIRQGSLDEFPLNQNIGPPVPVFYNEYRTACYYDRRKCTIHEHVSSKSTENGARSYKGLLPVLSMKRKKIAGITEPYKEPSDPEQLKRVF